MRQTTLVIGPERVKDLVDRAIARFADPPGTPCQGALHGAIRAARDEGEVELAAALVLVHAARGEGPEAVHEALALLLARQIEAIPDARRC